MKTIISILAFLYIPSVLNAQNKIQPIDSLINIKEPGWKIVKKWIAGAKNKVEVLSCDTIRSMDALYKTQVTTRSPMGAIIYKTGGILIDNGWIRILGSGNKKLNRTIPDWNKNKSYNAIGEKPSFLLIADDAIGGFFAINLGKFNTDLNKVFYMSPDDLKWEPLGISYSDFLLFCFNGDLNNFYNEFRWKDWKEDVIKLNGDDVYNFSNPLWNKVKIDINKNKRQTVSVEEQFQFNMQLSVKLNSNKE